jgi:putative ABC transport system permease protein
MVAVIVGLWTINELSFDRFHANSDNIYRINLQATLNNQVAKVGSTYRPLGETAKAELPQIKDMTRFYYLTDDIHIGTEFFSAVHLLAADANFFTFFTFPLDEGNPADVLAAPDRIVVSRSAVNRYFGGADPTGQRVEVWGKSFTVSGIMKDMPDNSSIQTDFVLPFFDWILTKSWAENDGYLTFFNIDRTTDIAALEASLTDILHREMPLIKDINGSYLLEPLSDMHFSGGGFIGERILKGNKSLVMIFMLIALIILVIACINFTNLFISTSFIRAKTIGVKKAHGADNRSLITGFYGETAFYVLISIAIGLFLANLALPLFNDFVQAHIEINPLSAQLYVFLAALFVLTTLLAGSFPAFYMTKFNPVETLFGRFRGKNVSLFQKSLIIVQFTASIAILTTVLFMRRQVDYMVNYDLGFDRENILYIQPPYTFAQDFESFRDEMMKEPAITDVTRSSAMLTNWNNGWVIANQGSTEGVLMDIVFVKENYFDFMGMQIIDGENPFPNETAASTTITPVVINESAAKLLDLQSPVNSVLIANSEDQLVVKGVLRNAYVRSLRDNVDPQIYIKDYDNSYSKPIFFKIKGDPQRAIAAISAKWEAAGVERAFEYHYLDDTYRELYKSEMNAGRIFIFAMLITMLISVAGLFAMAFYATQRRIREISLRKVHGATLRDLLILLNKDFVLWVVISFVLACPIAYFGLREWLDGFTVHTSLSLWLFILVGVVTLLIALLTTSWQTWKTAMTNPAKTLRS